MRIVERSIVIDASPEAVASVVHDPVQQPRWRSSLVAWHQDPPGPLRPGTRLHGVARVAGREVTSDYEVVAVDPDRSSTVRGVGAPVPFTATYDAAPADGGTLFTYRIAFEGRGVRRLVERAAAAIVGRQAAQDLPRLKALLDDAPPSAATGEDRT